MRAEEAYWASAQLRPAPMPDVAAAAAPTAAPAGPARGGRLSTALVALLVLLALAGAGARVAGLQPLTVLTGSMEPAIEPGDLVLVSRVPVTDIHPGQVVTFADPNGAARTVTHRVQRLRATSDDRVEVRTKGDANPVGERWTMPRGGEVGLVRAVVPHAGHVLHPRHSGFTGPLLLALLTLGGCFVALRVIWGVPGA